MIWFSQKILRKLSGNWSFVVITDREELDTQIHDDFADAALKPLFLGRGISR